MKRIGIFCLILSSALFPTCSKVQPVPSKLVGYWQLTKTYNAAYLTTTHFTTGSGYCLLFNDKQYSTMCKGGPHKDAKNYTFTADASNADNGTLQFKGKMDPDTYTISWSGDTLIMTPPSPVYDKKYYIKVN